MAKPIPTTIFVRWFTTTGIITIAIIVTGITIAIIVTVGGVTVIVTAAGDKGAVNSEGLEPLRGRPLRAPASQATELLARMRRHLFELLVPSPLPLYAPRLFCKLHDRYTKKEFTNCTRFSHPRSRSFANGTMPSDPTSMQSRQS